MVEKIAVKIPRSWRDDFLSLRDTLPEELGQQLIAALASRTPEQLQAMVEQLRAKGTPTTTMPTPVATPERLLLNRPVPYGLVGLFARLLDAAQEDPSRVRHALVRASKFL
jgi:hypothetical protein